MPNRLAQETSPYLLQHAGNPVDWHPWGPEALERARREDRPIFLSIGYAACHWCHVMEHESFENPAIAARLNELFVNVKVDREERPDLDQIYMSAVQLISGRGGWPMSMFLTPRLEPIFGGTYWPPTARHGMPGFDQVIEAVADAWQHRRPQALEQARQLTEHLKSLGRLGAGRGAAADLSEGAAELSPDLIEAAAARLERLYDPRYGGFGGAPKFPHPLELRVLLRAWRRRPRERLVEMASHTLRKMAAGGIYDQLGGGFHRYSVDERWLVPHFEKMLYDNALLVPCLLETYQITGDVELARVARETCDYVLREMTGPEGGFASTQDADSEGQEGKFYVWSLAEIEEALGPQRAREFAYVYDVTEAGNFEGHNILNRPKTWDQAAAILKRDVDSLRAQLAEDRRTLRGLRERRVRPGLDDKVLLSWNALMIEALALAGWQLEEPRYLESAARAADFLLSLRRDDGRLLHTWRAGRAKLDAYLDDYACLANALVTLYEATQVESRIDEALPLVELLLRHFADPDAGGFYYTAADHEPLIARQKDVFDSSVPSGNAMAATVLLRLACLTGRSDLHEAAARTLAEFAPLLRQSPGGTGQMLLALDFYLGPTPQLVAVGPGDASETTAALGGLRRRFLPNRVLACRGAAGDGRPTCAALDPLFAGKSALQDTATLYVCEHFTCQAPAAGPQAIAGALDELAASVRPDGS